MKDYLPTDCELTAEPLIFKLPRPLTFAMIHGDFLKKIDVANKILLQ